MVVRLNGLLMKYTVWTLVCAASFSMFGVAQAGQTQVGVALVVVSGSHVEAGGTTRGSISVPLLFVDHRTKRWELRAEGMGGLGPQQVSNSTYGLNSVSLSYASASARFAVTPYTAVGIVRRSITNAASIRSSDTVKPNRRDLSERSIRWFNHFGAQQTVHSISPLRTIRT